MSKKLSKRQRKCIKQNRRVRQHKRSGRHYDDKNSIWFQKDEKHPDKSEYEEEGWSK